MVNGMVQISSIAKRGVLLFTELFYYQYIKKVLYVGLYN